MTFAKVLDYSGLTKIELASLYGVSRQTIHGWAGSSPPRAGSLLARQAESITAALVKAIDARQLPFSPIDKELRRARIAKMAARLQELKPAPVR